MEIFAGLDSVDHVRRQSTLMLIADYVIRVIESEEDCNEHDYTA